MEAMPRHDPVPPHRRAAPLPDEERRAIAWARYRQTMKWMALAALVTVLLALVWLKSFGEPVPIHMTIATILGALSLMTRRRIRHLPVVDGEALVGLVSIGDLVKFRMDRIEAEAEAMRNYIQSV